MICFLAFLSLYASITVCGVIYLENKYERNRPKFHQRWTRKVDLAMDKTLDMVNFINAVNATILSSVALYNMESSERTDMVGRKSHSTLVEWTIESVCAYLTVEMTFLFVSSYRLSQQSWKWVKESYKDTVIFHVIAFVGLISVLLAGAGYSVAMWTIWSELTSVFLGIQGFLEEYRFRHTIVYRAVELFVSVVFVVQRVFVFLYLLCLCIMQFTVEVAFIVQFSILVAGTAVNIFLAWHL